MSKASGDICVKDLFVWKTLKPVPLYLKIELKLEHIEEDRFYQLPVETWCNFPYKERNCVIFLFLFMLRLQSQTSLLYRQNTPTCRPSKVKSVKFTAKLYFLGGLTTHLLEDFAICCLPHFQQMSSCHVTLYTTTKKRKSSTYTSQD